MKDFEVWAIYSTSKCVGTFEAETEEEAFSQAEISEEFEEDLTICAGCTRDVLPGDVSFVRFEAVKPEVPE